MRRFVFALVVTASASSASAGPEHATASELVPFQLGIREALHDLFAWTAQAPSPIPDLSILTRDPVTDGESSGFGWRDDPFRHRPRFHTGTDFRGDPGTPIVAAGDGIVSFTGRYGGYGNAIKIDHGGGVVTLYGHLRKIEIREGAAVTAGSRIGQMGSTGRATGPHLHFEVRLEGRPVDPVLAMTVAELARENPEAARLASFALMPEIQAHAQDEHAPALPSPRPERKHRSKRTQVLW